MAAREEANQKYPQARPNVGTSSITSTTSEVVGIDYVGIARFRRRRRVVGCDDVSGSHVTETRRRGYTDREIEKIGVGISSGSSGSWSGRKVVPGRSNVIRLSSGPVFYPLIEEDHSFLA
jgi:hypothetical protein